MFCQSVKLDDDPFLVHADIVRATAQLACYAMFLSLGCTLRCRSITGATIKTYLKDVAASCSTLYFAEHGEERDPRYLPGFDTLAPIIEGVITEHERWAKVPNRREPFTVEMLKQHENDMKLANATNDSLLATLADYYELGLLGGLRVSEIAPP